MKKFAYKGVTFEGKTISGVNTAPSKNSLKAELEQNNLIVLDISENTKSKTLKTSFRSIKLDDLISFNRELTVLLHAGISVPRALEILKKRDSNKRLQAIIGQLHQDVQQGQALSAACEKCDDLFDKSHIAMIAIGEKSGTLDQNLEHIQNSLAFRKKISSQIKKAMTYPLFLLFTLALALAFLFIVVMPNFISMYDDFGAQLPQATRILIFITHHIHFVTLGLVGLAMGTIFAFKYLYTTPTGKTALDTFTLSLPLIGGFIKAKAVAVTSRMLSTLLKAGVPLVSALEITATSQANHKIAEQLHTVRQDVIAGEALHTALESHALFPDISIKIIEAGEYAGCLDDMLNEIANFHEEKLEKQLSTLTSLIEPGLILLVGLLIGSVIVAMYLPIFSISDVIQ